MSTRRRGARRQQTQNLSIGSLILLFALLLLIYANDEGWLDRWLGDEPATTGAPAPQADPNQPADARRAFETSNLIGYEHGPVQVYFTRPSYPERREGRQGGLDETVAADIDRARRSVDIAVFDLDLRKVGEALIRAHQRGLTVRAVIDGQNLEAPEVAELTGEMQEAGVPITFDQRSAFMHNKFVVIDQAVVWTGSWNPTINDTFRNNNNFIRLAEPRLAADYTRKFDLLFDGRGGPSNPAALQNPVVEANGFRVELNFSPDSDITGKVVEALRNARSSIDLLAFAFTSDPIAEELIAARDRGVTVRVVMESRNARGTGSELPVLREAGVDVLEDGNCYIMHHKVIVIDGTRVITGSFNWSAQAQRSNDENTVMVDNQWFAQRYAEEFQRVYDLAREPLRCGR